MFHFSVNGRVRTDFDPTPIMSTYLVAFIVSDYANKKYNATADFPTTHRVFASDKVINQTSYAFVEAITILKALENYLQVSFALPKLDQVVVAQNPFGGMILKIISSLIKKEYMSKKFNLFEFT